MIVVLTTLRAAIAASRSARVKPSRRAASATYGAGGCWPCSGVRRRIASAGASRRRSSSPWRAASAAVSSGRVSVRTAVSLRGAGATLESRAAPPAHPLSRTPARARAAETSKGPRLGAPRRARRGARRGLRREEDIVTRNRALKQAVRERAARTGEKYSAARRALVEQPPVDPGFERQLRTLLDAATRTPPA